MQWLVSGQLFTSVLIELWAVSDACHNMSASVKSSLMFLMSAVGYLQ